MYTPYEIDRKMSKENAARIAQGVENHRAYPGERDAKPRAHVTPKLTTALGILLSYLRPAHPSKTG